MAHGREPVHQRLDHHAADDRRRAPPAGAQREGEYGRNKINQYTRYLTVPLALLQAYGYLATACNAQRPIITDFDILRSTTMSQMLTLAAGTMLAMWIGELITERGIGNGISFIIFAGIVARVPQGVGVLPRPTPTSLAASPS